MLGILISAASLCIIMYLVARHEADYSLPKVILIAAGLAIINFILSVAIGQLISLPIMLGLTVWALHQFCYLRWSMAAVVTGIYIVVQIALGMLFAGLTS